MKNEHDDVEDNDVKHNDVKYNAAQIDTAFSRRTLMSGSAALAATAVLSGQASAATRSVASRPTLVHVFLRGAMDGLTFVPPYTEAPLYSRRPKLAIKPPGQTNGALDLDGFFGLAPAAAPLLTPYTGGHLAIVHASGSDDATRSHFEAEVRMESGDSSLATGAISTGWIARYLTATTGTSSLRAIQAGSLIPFSLRGAFGALPIPDFTRFVLPGHVPTAAARQAVLEDTYVRRSPPVGPAAVDTMASLGLGGIDFAAYVPQNGAQYPTSALGQRLRQTAAIIKAGIGIEVVTLDVDGWDLHAQQGPINGPMSRLMRDLARSFEAFYLDMLGHLDKYVLVCVSEFGRHLNENGSDGTDHGHGNAMFVLGGRVNGGQVIANWPGLRPVDLDQGDLAVTIDYRDIMAELLLDLMGFSGIATVFPQHSFSNHGITT